MCYAMKKMRILYAYYNTDIPSPAAPSFQIFRMCQALALLGHHVELICFISFRSSRRPLKDVFDYYGVTTPFRVSRIPIRGMSRIPRADVLYSSAVSLITLLYSIIKGFDIIYTRQSTIAYYGVKLGKKVIYETHPLPFGEQKDWDGKEKEGELVSLMQQSEFLALVVLSSVVKSSFVRMGVPERKIIVQPSGVDFQHYIGLPDKISARKAVNLPAESKVIVYSGRLSRMKGTLLILDLASKMNDVTFLLLGHIGEGEIQTEIDRRDLGNVVFHGLVKPSELPLWFGSADVLLLPTLCSDSSSVWTSPLKLFEYMASGTPIVTSKLPNILDVVSHLESALIVPDDNVDLYEEAIRYLLDNPDHARRIGVVARSLSIRYTWETRANQIISSIDGGI